MTLSLWIGQKNAATFNITFQVSIPRGAPPMEQKQMSSDSANLTANYQYTHVNGSVPALAKQFAIGPAQCKKLVKLSKKQTICGVSNKLKYFQLLNRIADPDPFGPAMKNIFNLKFFL